MHPGHRWLQCFPQFTILSWDFRYLHFHIIFVKWWSLIFILFTGNCLFNILLTACEAAVPLSGVTIPSNCISYRSSFTFGICCTKYRYCYWLLVFGITNTSIVILTLILDPESWPSSRKTPKNIAREAAVCLCACQYLRHRRVKYMSDPAACLSHLFLPKQEEKQPRHGTLASKAAETFSR